MNPLIVMTSLLEPVWLWGILGLILLVLEMLTGTLYLLWFGIAAICVSALSFAVPSLALAWQLLLFSGLSLASLAVWKLRDRTSPNLRVGQSVGDEIGQSGTITEAVGPQQTGRIEFAQGVLGSRSWPASAHEPLAVGATAFIVAVEGNRLRVASKAAA